MRIPFGFFGNLINSIIANFKNTVFANNGIFEAENYLYNILNSLMAYYNSFVVFITANAYEQNFLFAIKPTPITENYYLQTISGVGVNSFCTAPIALNVSANFTVIIQIEPYLTSADAMNEFCGSGPGGNGWALSLNSSSRIVFTAAGLTSSSNGGMSGNIPSLLSANQVPTLRVKQWIRISKTAASTYDFYYSIDGINWTSLGGSLFPVFSDSSGASGTSIRVGLGNGSQSFCFIGKIFRCKFFSDSTMTTLLADFNPNDAQVGRYSTWKSPITGEVWSISQSSGNPQISNQGVALYTGGGSRFRTNSAGLLEDVKKNLIQFSEDFSQSIWQKSNVTTVSNNAIAPDGTMTASTITFANVNAQILQSFTTIIGVSYTYTTWVKGIAGQRTNINILKPTSPFENTSLNLLFDGSWQMVSLTFTALSTTTEVQIRNNFPVGNLTATNFSWWRVMVEVGSAYTAYQYTTTDAIYPRLDYTYGEPAILSEPASTNYALQSNNFNNGWTLTNMTVTPNQPNSLTGLNDATLLTQTSTTGTVHRFTSTTIPANTRISNSFYFKNVNATTFRVQMSDGWNGEISVTYTVSGSSTPVYLSNSTNSFIINPTFNVKSVGNGWYKITTSFTLYSSPAVLTPSCLYVGTIGNGKSILIYGSQLEDKSFDTSYIPTTTATVTRVADSFNYINNSIINQTQGILYFEFYFNGTNSANGFKGLIGISDVNGITNTDYIACAYNSDGSSLQVFLRSGNVNRVSSFFSSFANGINKIAIVFSPTLVTAYMNGVNMGSATPNNSPNSWAVTLDRIQIGNQVPILIKNIAYMPSATALTNSQLLALTT
jgi:hypothetical protein